MPSRAELLALLAASAVAFPRTAFADTPAIRIGAATGETYSEPFYAIAHGAFEQVGLTATAQTLSNGGTIMQACMAGALDVGLGDLFQIVNAVNAGIPMSVFAASALYTSDAPTTALVVPKDSAVRSAKDLEGKTIALNSLHSFPEVATREWIRQNGGDADQVRFIEVNGAAMLEVLFKGAIGAALPGEPHLSLDKDRVRILGKPYDTIAKSFPITMFYARKDWLRTNADVARRIQSAFYQTARWANDHHAETALVIEKTAKMDAATVQVMTRARYATELRPAQLQPLMDIALKYRAVKAAIPVAELVTTL